MHQQIGKEKNNRKKNIKKGENLNEAISIYQKRNYGRERERKKTDKYGEKAE